MITLMAGIITVAPTLTLTQGCFKSGPFYLPELLSLRMSLLICHQVMVWLEMHNKVVFLEHFFPRNTPLRFQAICPGLSHHTGYP